MIKPPDLTAADYVVALKPALGYEGHLYFSLKSSLEPGALEVTGANTGTYTASAAAVAALSADPMELLAMLDTGVDLGAANLVMTVTGTRANGTALTGTATFKVPDHATLTDRVFPRGWAVQVESGDVPFKTITGVSLTCDAKAAGLKIILYAIPALTTFQEVACKTSVNVTPMVPMPHSIACGRNLSAYTKPGEIPIGQVSMDSKLVTSADGIPRINGRTVTGLLVTKKEDKLITDYLYLLGLTVAAKLNVGDSVAEQTMSAEGQTEDTPWIAAKAA